MPDYTHKTKVILYVFFQDGSVDSNSVLSVEKKKKNKISKSM